MRMYEFASSRTYYHGSMEHLPVGTILTPRDAYEDRWGGTSFYTALEKYRPEGHLSHRESVFMCDNGEDVDLAGGGTEWLFKVVPLGRVEKHDMNWSSEISGLMDDGHSIDDDEVRQAAINYWMGVPHPNESVWEYLTPSAKITHVEEY